MEGPVGVTFPGVVRHGVIHSAANVDKAWIGTDADALFTEACGADVHVVNDADAAGLAEVRFGAGADVPGVVIVLTFGTGIGSGMFIDGVLVPNTELGHLEIDGHDAERGPRPRPATARACRGRSGPTASSATSRSSSRCSRPSLIIVGGGASRKADKWVPHLDVGVEIVPAALENEAGIVGAALVGAMADPLT